MIRNTTITKCRQPMAPRERVTQQSCDARRQTKQSNQLSLPHQDDRKTRMDIK